MKSLRNLTPLILFVGIVYATLVPKVVYGQHLPTGIEAVEEASDGAGEDADVPSGEESEKTDTVGEELESDNVEESSEEVAEGEEDLGGLIDGIVSAFQSKNWTLVFAFSLMIVIVVARKFGVVDKFVPVKAIPWVSLGLGVFWALASGLVAGQAWGAAILEGLTVGLSATGLWEALGKSVFSSSSSEGEAA
jgi:hypothetical protein